MPTWMKVMAQVTEPDVSLQIGSIWPTSGRLRRASLIARMLFFSEPPSPVHKLPVSPALASLCGNRFLFLWQQDAEEIQKKIPFHFQLGHHQHSRGHGLNATDNPSVPLLRQSRVTENNTCYQFLSTYCAPSTAYV